MAVTATPQIRIFVSKIHSYMKSNCSFVISLPKIIRYGLTFTVLVTFVTLTSYAEEPIFYAPNASKTIIINGDDLLDALYICKDCDYTPQVYEDIDGDGLIESVLITDNIKGIQIEFEKRNSQGQLLHYEILHQDFESEESLVYETVFNIIIYDFDSDGRCELIIAYDNDSEGISGHVYKINGKNINFEELHNIIFQSGLNITNVLQDTGKFTGGWNDSTATIDRDTIDLQVSPRGNVYVTYLYRNGKLYRLEE